MGRRRSRRSKRVGLSPGSLIYTEEPQAKPVKISLLDYDMDHVLEREMQNVEECFPYRDKPTVSWIDVEGQRNIEALQKIGDHYGVHPLVLEDIVHTDQRPKFEDHGSLLFIVVRMLRLIPNRDEVEIEQVSLIVGENFVISFQEGKEGDVFEPVRVRIRSGKGRIRKMRSDYLAYALVDCVVDNYFVVLEQIETRLSAIDTMLLSRSETDTLKEIHDFKREILFLRKTISPLREAVTALQKSESPLIKDGTEIFLRDLHDHIIEASDTIETFRDMVSGLTDVYLSNASHRTNQVIQFLTIMASIFIPLTFIVGIYGMNFDYMPELRSRFGYPAVLTFMAILAGGMLLFFKKRGWI